MENSFEYTNDWFGEHAKSVWDHIIPQISPTKILEVGSFEGASTCYLIDKIGANQNLEIHCVDTWEGSVEHKPGGMEQTDMSAVERRFIKNTQIAKSRIKNNVDLVTHKNLSIVALSNLISIGMQGYFDFIYIDGSHQAPDVLCDSLLGFQLLKTNGYMAFDDYLWQEPLSYGTDPVRCPKMAIDAFTNIYARKLRLIRGVPLYQLFVQKISD